MRIASKNNYRFYNKRGMHFPFYLPSSKDEGNIWRFHIQTGRWKQSLEINPFNLWRGILDDGNNQGEVGPLIWVVVYIVLFDQCQFIFQDILWNSLFHSNTSKR